MKVILMCILKVFASLQEGLHEFAYVWGVEVTLCDAVILVSLFWTTLMTWRYSRSLIWASLFLCCVVCPTAVSCLYNRSWFECIIFI